MDTAKKDKIVEWLLFAFLVFFPFGQLLGLRIDLFGLRIPLYLIEVVIGILLFFTFLIKPKTPLFHKYFKNFIYLSLFSLIVSLVTLGSPRVLVGGLYLVRLIAYYLFFVVVWNLTDRNRGVKTKLFDSLLTVSSTTAVFGWIQYLVYPDLRALVEWGWDDHLYRLVGTFLDPTFTGIIIVFGFLMSVTAYLHQKKKKYLLLLSLFFLVSVGLTYSRASYLALLAGGTAVFFLKKRTEALFLTAAVLLVVIFFLPRPGSEGVQLERLRSIEARLINYSETIRIFQKSPLFGTGFNNLCLAKEVYFGEQGWQSHSCGGADSSLLLVLATTGVVGLLLFLSLVGEIIRSIKKDIYGVSLLGNLVALLTHSLFSNSLFYPWVLGWVAILLSISLKKQT